MAREIVDDSLLFAAYRYEVNRHRLSRYWQLHPQADNAREWANHFASRLRGLGTTVSPID